MEQYQSVTQQNHDHHVTNKMLNQADENSNANGDSDSNNGETQLEKIQQMGSVLTNNGKHRIHCLTIIGQIEGHFILPSQNKTTKYEHIIPQLVAIEE